MHIRNQSKCVVHLLMNHISILQLLSTITLSAMRMPYLIRALKVIIVSHVTVVPVTVTSEAVTGMTRGEQE